MHWSRKDDWGYWMKNFAVLTGLLGVAVLGLTACSTTRLSVNHEMSPSNPMVDYCVSVQGNGQQEQLAWHLRKRMLDKGFAARWCHLPEEQHNMCSCRVLVKLTYALNPSNTAFQWAALRYQDRKTLETQRVSVKRPKRSSAFFSSTHESTTQRLYDMIDRLFPDQYTPRLVQIVE